MADREVNPVPHPQGLLEENLKDEYLRGLGHDPQQLRARNDEEAVRLKKDAALYASGRLAEFHCRSQYTRAIHGTK